MTVLSVVLGFCVTTAFIEYTGATICPFIGLGVTGLATIIAGRWMPSKTRKGAEMASRWEAFKRYLREIERYTDLDEATDLFERYLP